MYHRDKCQSCIRRVSNLNNGLVNVKIIVAGQHSFEWSVTVIKSKSQIQVVFDSREPALREYRRLLKQYKDLGDVRV